MSYFAQLAQNVILSTGNSKSDALAGSTTFTGTSQSTLGVAGIQVNLFSSQNCTVYVDQSMDGSNWDIVDTYNYYSSKGGMSWTTQATAAYTRVRVTNLSASQANPFRLQTALCPIVEAVPRALSEEGNLKVGVYEIEGDYGTRVEVTPMNALKASTPVRLVGSVFGAAYDTNFWATTVATGTATATVANDVLTLATNPSGTANGNSAIVNSVRTARYVSGMNNYARIVATVPATTGANTKRWGAFDASNGYYFKFDGTTLSVGCRKGGSDTDVASGSFNGVAGASYTLNANVHTYEIAWTHRSVWFFIDGVLLHKVTATTTPSVNTCHLKLGFECTNGGANNANNTLNINVASISRNGALNTQPTSKYISTVSSNVLKLGPGNLHTIVIGSLPSTAGTINIYDNTTNSGSLIFSLQVSKATQASQVPMQLDFQGLPFYTGLTVEVLTNAPTLCVIYE